MQPFRHLLAQRHLAALLLAAALLLKLLVPTGYMIAVDHGRLSIIVCPGMTPAPTPMPMAGMDHGMAQDMAMPHDPAKPADHGKAEMPCAFAGLSAQVLGAVDIVLLAIALAVVAAMALRGRPTPAPRDAPRLRPPLRGPPLPA